MRDRNMVNPEKVTLSLFLKNLDFKHIVAIAVLFLALISGLFSLGYFVCSNNRKSEVINKLQLLEKENEALKSARNSTINDNSLRHPIKVNDYFVYSLVAPDPRFVKISYLKNTMKISYGSNEIGWARMLWTCPKTAKGLGKGLNIEGAKKVVFLAKGENGKEKICFKTGGVQINEFGDSFEKSKVVWLTKTWAQYEIELHDLDLSSVVSPFSWHIQQLNPVIFYLKDIYIHF